MSKIRIALQIECFYDTETGEYTPISQKVIQSIKQEYLLNRTTKIGETEPLVLLDTSGLYFNNFALKELGAEIGDRITIQYSKNENGELCPVVALSDVYGVKSGNKLTQKGKISFRGKNNDELQQWGTEFRMIKQSKGIYFLVGDKTPPKEYLSVPKIVDEQIKITENSHVISTESPIDISNFDTLLEDSSDEISFNLVL